MSTILILAAIYGALVSGNFVKAPDKVVVDDVWRGSAFITEPQANALGYKLVLDERPACSSNEYAVAVGWTEDARISRVYEKRIIVQPPRKFSKLKIYGAIAQLGAWDTVEAWLKAKTINGVNGWMAFQLAQEVSEDHPLFAPMSEEARQLLGLSAEQFEALLNSCILEG